jgi:hypothetical protein
MPLLDDDEPSYLDELGLNNNAPVSTQRPQQEVYQEEYTSIDEPLPLEVVDEQDEVSQQLSEAEKKFSKAALYKQWISNRLYEGDGPEVLEVEAEFKEFALLQLKRLLGIEPAVTKVTSRKDFTDEEILALKTLAGQIINNPKLRAKPQTVEKPIVRQVAEKPQPREVKPPVQPQLRSRQVPPEASQPAPVQKPAAPPKPAPRPQQKPQPTQPAPRKKVPADGETIQEDGKTYKVSYIGMSSAEYGPVEEKRINTMPKSAAILLKNGIQVLKNGQGEIFKIIRQDVTPIALPDNMVRFPQPSEMLGITQVMSDKASQLGNRITTNKINGRRG